MLCCVMTVAPALAQDTPPPPAESVQAPESDEKPYLIDGSGPVARCAIAAYRKCLKLDQGECEAATRSATDKANAEIEGEAAKVSSEDAESAFFQGMAMGTFIRHMQQETGGRFFGCMDKAR
jgi:hypothetical protein